MEFTKGELTNIGMAIHGRINQVKRMIELVNTTNEEEYKEDLIRLKNELLDLEKLHEKVHKMYFSASEQ